MISVVIIASNSQKYIKECLDSVKEFEVILYLNNSTDDTKKIASKYKNVKIIDGYFDGYGKTKNRAISYASNDWIFVLDSDEVMSEELKEEIMNLHFDNANICYKVNRKNLFLEEEVKFSGWNPDWIIRLFNKKITKFSDVEVHESILTNNLEIRKLENRIIHYAINDVRDFLLKTYKYSNLKRKNLKVYSPFFIFFKSLFAFIRVYFLKLGFLDGYKGLVIAVGEFNGVFFKYIVNYIRNKK